MDRIRSLHLRRQCRECGAHTYGPACGCCRSDDLVQLSVKPKRPRLPESELVIQPALLPFTAWAP